MAQTEPQHQEHGQMFGHFKFYLTFKIELLITNTSFFPLFRLFFPLHFSNKSQVQAQSMNNKYEQK